MRVSTSMLFDAGVNAINRQTASLLNLQQQVATGRRILTPADDPVGAARVLEVTQSKDILAQYSTNQSNATSSLGLEEAQLSSINDMFARIKELTVQAGNAALNDSDKRSIAFELRARFDELLGIANSADGQGQFIFAGYMGSTKPFGGNVDALNAAVLPTDPNYEISYDGDDGQRKLQVSATRLLEISDSGNDVFKRIRNGNGYFVTNYGTNSVTPGPNLGTGVIDVGNVTDPAAWNLLANKNLSINFTVTAGVTTYEIVDGASNVLVAAGAPYSPNQPIVIPGAGASITISGDPANGDSFTLKPSSSQSVFKTLATLIKTLETTNAGTSADNARYANEIGFALNNFDQANDNMLRVRAMIGSRMAELDSLGKVNEDLNLQYQQTISNLQDLDYAKTISDLTRKQTDLEAAQKSFMRMSQLSLFNYL